MHDAPVFHKTKAGSRKNANDIVKRSKPFRKVKPGVNALKNSAGPDQLFPKIIGSGGRRFYKRIKKGET